MSHKIRFRVGQPICHKQAHYRGIVIKADPIFGQTESWYDIMITAKPPKNEPWYWVLLDDSVCMAYISQADLTPDLTGVSINNPLVTQFFSVLQNGLYQTQ